MENRTKRESNAKRAAKRKAQLGPTTPQWRPSFNKKIQQSIQKLLKIIENSSKIHPKPSQNHPKMKPGALRAASGVGAGSWCGPVKWGPASLETFWRFLSAFWTP